MARILVALLVLLLGAARADAQAPTAQGAWLRAESAHFIVYSQGGERSLRDTVQELESFDATLRRMTRLQGEPPPTKLTVYLLNNQAAMSRLVRGAAGFYMARSEFIGAFALRRSDSAEWTQHVLFHEYTHHFMLQNFPQAYPRWYVEGFAEYMSTVEFTRGTVVVGRPSQFRGWTLANDTLLPVNELLAPPRRMTQDAVAMFYAQSWLFTHYLFSNNERLRKGYLYLNAISAGEDPIAAFEPAFGMSPDAFYDELRRYRNGRVPYLTYPDRQLEDAEVTITRLPRSADQLLIPYARLRYAYTDEQRNEAISDIRTEAARFPGDAFAVRVQAYAEQYENPERAREMLAPLLEANPEDAELLFIMGRSHVVEAAREGADRRAQMSSARRYFARASRADANHVPTLYFFSRTFEGEVLSDNGLDALVQAHVLAPYVAEIRLNAGVALMNASRFDEAAVVIRPLIFSPHDQNSAERARRLLEAAQQRQFPSREALALEEDEAAAEDEED